MIKRTSFFTFIFWTITCAAYAQFAFQYKQDIPVVVGEDTLQYAWAGGINSGQYNTIDLNGDSKSDLVIFDRTANRILTFINENSKYIYRPVYAALFPTGIKSWMLLIDYNCDGKEDLFTASGSRGITVYRNKAKNNEPISWSLVSSPLLTKGFSGFQVSLPVGSSDIPGITDIDRDGDLDIIVYNVNGRGDLEYYQNQSIEQYGKCDSLVFHAIDRRWGGVKACDCNQFVFGMQECYEEGRQTANTKEQHVGGKSVLAIDVDGDQDKDLLLGNAECSALYFMKNVGTAEQARFESFETRFPKLNPAGFYVFPTAYYEDVDLDGVKDLIVAPNASHNDDNSIDFTASSWLYKNTQSDEAPEFSFVTKTFLQGEMIDVGENAVPAFADYDADGDMDLFISNRGRLREDGFYASILLYENKGSATQPEFILKATDFANLSVLQLHDLKIHFTDLNADALPEMIVSGAKPKSNQGYLYILENPRGFPYQFDIKSARSLNFELSPEDNIAFYDANADGQQDLFLGKQSGSLDFYINNGTGLKPEWILENENAGGIDANISRLYLSLFLFDLDQNGTPELISTDISGKLLIRSDFIHSMNHPEEIIVDTARLNNIQLNIDRTVRLGKQTWLTASDLYGNGKVILMVGGQEGGISALQLDYKEGNESSDLLIYPNPSDGAVLVRAKYPVKALQIINIAGQLLSHQEMRESHSQLELPTTQLPAGLYLLKAFLANGKVQTGKLIVHKN